jgi:hypothetical protein
MVISEKYKTIFVRIPKNASTSLATFFVQNCCDENDRYTGIGDSRIKTNNIEEKIVKKHREQYRFIHLTLNELIEEKIVNPNELNDKKVIGVIRDPIERQLSLFFYKHRTNIHRATPKAFRNEFANGYHHSDGSNHILQSDYTMFGDKQIGTFWLYDNLDYYLNQYIKDNNINAVNKLASFKSSIKPKDDNLIQEFYDKATLKAVEEYYAKDIELYEKLKDENR